MRPAGVLLVAVSLVITFSTSSAGVLDSLKCGACSTAVSLLSTLTRWTGSKSVIGSQVQIVCSILSVPEPACDGYMSAWLEPLTYIMTHTELSSSELCGVYLPNCGDDNMKIEGFSQPPHHSRSVETDRDRDIHYPDRGQRGLKVLHLADIHLDQHYRIGAPNECSYPLCCRFHPGEVPGDDIKGWAATWGDYNCDAPPWLLHALLGHLRREHLSELDYVLWTGDNVPHDGWKTSPSDVLTISRMVSSMVNESLPGVSVVPVIGNHDSAPINYFPPPNVRRDGFRIEWLYDSMAQMWKHWLPASAMTTFRRGGFYVLDIRPGLRLIVLNTNVAYRYNLWAIMTARQDVHGQLSWLAEQLQLARDRRMKCHIVGHVSPADADILPPWSRAYYHTIESYRDVVTSQFFSHTHLDEVQVFHDSRHHPFSMSYVSPSATPWRNINPGYRIYHIDGARGSASTWEVIDYEKWSTDLAEANRNPEEIPRWRHAYNASQMFGLNDLSPKNWHLFVERLRRSKTNLIKYHSLLSGKERDPSENTCDEECRQRVLCHLVAEVDKHSSSCS